MIRILAIVMSGFMAIQACPCGATKTYYNKVYDRETKQYEMIVVKEEEIPGLFDEAVIMYSEK